MKGLTLIEVLISILILMILALSIPFGIDFYKRQELENQAQQILQTLRRAQLKSMAVELSSNFGVYFGQNSYILFKGDSYSQRDSQYDEVFEIPEILEISGLSEIVFLKFQGIPNSTGTIILSLNGEIRSIEINEAGRINLQ